MTCSDQVIDNLQNNVVLVGMGLSNYSSSFFYFVLQTSESAVWISKGESFADIPVPILLAETRSNQP